MRISHVNSGEQVNFIEVRQYENSIVNVAQVSKPSKSEFCAGVWKVRRLNIIPNDYNPNCEFIRK